MLFAHAALADDPRAPSIWYRASESCPGSAEFVQKLAENGHPVRIAQGGDHIDFVVTLLAAEGGTVGRLERQTQSGTVAIRELRDATCERVADALALSLGLAVDPDAPESKPALPETHPPAPLVPEAPAPLPSEPAPVAMAPVSAPPPTAASSSASPAPRWSLGLALGGAYGIATHPLPRGEAFVTLDRPFDRVLPDLSLRLGMIGALGSFSTQSGEVQRTLLAARAEACPLRVGNERVDVRPCLVGELGVTRASRSEPVDVDATSLWWAPGFAIRGELGVSQRIRLEATLAALVPRPRHEVAVGETPVYRDAIIAFSGTVGASFALP